MPSCKNILLVRFKSIGDILLTLPAVHAVRENFRAAKISFLTSIENASLLSGFADVDEVITIDRAALRSGNPLKMGGELFRLIKRLRSGKFSLVIDFQGYGETAWLTRITGAPERWATIGRRAHGWAYSCRVQTMAANHLADTHLNLLKQCGLNTGIVRNEFVLPGDALAKAKEFFIGNHVNLAKPVLFLQPFTSSPQKDWPLKNYLALAGHFQSHNLQIVFGGGPSDRVRLAPVKEAGFIVAAGEPLLISAGLVKLSTLTVGGITGLLHLAVAMQKRVVMLMGPKNEPGFPYQHPDWGLTPDVGSNVADISVPTVVDACSRAFGEICR